MTIIKNKLNILHPSLLKHTLIRLLSINSFFRYQARKVPSSLK